MMRSERLAEVLYRAFIDSAEPINVSMSRPPSWLELGQEGRKRWREVADAALVFEVEVEEWHGKTTRAK